ncbi:MAG: 16S rRNA (cytosine(1402)-N(4))-methyltransferase RsmH [Victivallaceae bacterium]|nr:16S rRNA (cytosine(1402)-N(4))-methyltransferase RsmH [Victivallaceae bacterium]
MADDQPPQEEHKRRIHYRGTHPHCFAEKYKEHQPEKYAGQIEKLIAQGQTPAGSHRPICVREILEILKVQPGETGLDATLGFGGHSAELLRRIVPGGRLYATDVDPIEMPKTVARLAQAGFGPEVLFPRQMNFAGIAKLLPETPRGGFDFVLADLGISSMQLDNPQRGFSFKFDGPLDLRLNPNRGKSVADMLLEWSRDDLEKMLRMNSDEPLAAFLADGIYAARGTIRTTGTLSQVVRQVVSSLGNRGVELTVKKTLPRVFQAFRIAVNGEFTVLEQFLRTLPYAVLPKGRIALLTFHSGEANRVVAAFRDGLAQGRYQAVSEEPIQPSIQERFSNPRSKAARLHWAVRGDE